MANTLKFGNSEWYGTEGNILAYNDENGNFKPLPFDFSRGSKATRVNQQGLIETVGANDARVDYLDNANGALLLEPSRTNFLPNSNKFINTSWQYFRGTIIANATTSPDGTLNASRYQEDSQTGSHLFRRQSLSLTNGSSYTGSIFVKKGELSTVRLLSNSSSRWDAGAEFNLENGTVISGTGVIKNYGNGWYRCSISGNAVQTTSEAGFEIYTSTGAGSDGDGLFMYGAMFEQGSYPTSIIKTEGAAQTRLADSCSQGGLLDKGVLNNNALTLFFNSTLTSDTTNQFLDIISMHHSTASKEIRIESRTNNILYIQQGGVVNSGDNFNSLNLGSNSINFKKIAIVLTQTQFKVFADGSQIGSTLNGSYNVNFDSLGFQTFNGAVQTKIQNKEIKLYNTALSDSELAALTQV